jgi:lipoprotein-anchoring transpeptidase ErfK/SrfK
MSRRAMKTARTYAATIAAVACNHLSGGMANADPLGFSGPFNQAGSAYQQVVPKAGNVEDSQDAAEVPARLRRQVVAYATREIAGTIVVDTPNTYLYYVLGQGRAIRYGIGVGREGFTWAGTQSVARKQEWPDWHPPAEMIERQPYLPRMMAGGPGNPLGARAMYLGNSIYRIHGTNAPDTIGTRVSSGCIRLTNEDVRDLFDRVLIGTKVVVLPMQPMNSPSIAERDRPILPALRAAAAGGSIAHRLY